MKQGKPLASSLCDGYTGTLINQHQNAKLIFGQNLQKRFKIESEHQYNILHIQISLL